MGAAQDLLGQVMTQASPYMSLPLAPVQPLSTLVSHLVTAPVFPGLPIARFGALHAARVAIVWAGMTKAKRAARSKKVGLMGDLFGYLTMCCKFYQKSS